MKKEILSFIKKDMCEVRSNRKLYKAQLKHELNELEIRRKDALAIYVGIPVSDDYGEYSLGYINDLYKSCRNRVIESVRNDFYNEQTYYIIYKDHTEVYITAEDILNGEKLPKFTDIVYAEIISADNHMDTETGEIEWEKGPYDNFVADQIRWEYETAIQYKYGTEWSKRFGMLHPDYVPMEI